MEQKKVIALCTSRIYDPQVHGYIEKLNERLAAENAALLIFTINSDLYWEDENITAETTVFDILPYDFVDVVVYMDEKIKSHTIANQIIERARKHQKPVIILDGSYEGQHRISFDYAAGFEKVVRHVLDSKKVRFPHIMAGIPDNPFSDERIEVFKKVIKEYGYTFREEMLSYGQFWAAPAIRETEKMIASGNVPDAIICANDIMAINVCDVLMSNGYSIPQDVMVSGFDGYDEVFIATPHITTVSCITPELADASADLILRLASGEKTGEEPVSVSVVPTLITNESTGAESQSGYDRFMLSRFNNVFYRHHDATRVMYEIATRMQMSKTPEEMVSHLKELVVNDQNIIEDVSFVLHKDLFDVKDYFFDEDETMPGIHEYNITYDANLSPILKKRSVKETLLRPENKSFSVKLLSGYPLIFNTIDYMDKPMGYICYNYADYDITKYSRTANVTNTLSMGIGGFVNMRYQQSLVEQVKEMYRKDALTGLLNRLGFNDVFDKLLADTSLYGKSVTVIMSDLDGLKYINDTFGHAEGDHAIFMVAQALKEACPKGAICVRFGGDEMFAVILGKCDVEAVTDKLGELLDQYNEISDKEYTIQASFGTKTCIFDADFDIRSVLRFADEQMYSAKKARKNAAAENS